MNILVGNAPCSWGTWGGNSPLSYEQMLDELAEAGYTGTELGDWGFMPSSPQALRSALGTRGLTMTGAYVSVNFSLGDPAGAGEAEAVKVANLLATVADPAMPPYLVLGDDAEHRLERMANAGRITPAMGMTAREWDVYAATVNRVAARVNAASGLRCVFHHHTGVLVETPAEIDELLARTSPAMVGLVFDTGHYALGTGAPSAQGVMDALERYKQRIWYVHYKDCDPAVAAQSRVNNWGYRDNVAHGIFCELGKGCVPFDRVTAWLKASGYQGYITVEQDVLPGMGAPRDSARRNREYLREVCRV